jgi:hypothetical protein
MNLGGSIRREIGRLEDVPRVGFAHFFAYPFVPLTVISAFPLSPMAIKMHLTWCIILGDGKADEEDDKEDFEAEEEPLTPKMSAMASFGTDVE